MGTNALVDRSGFVRTPGSCNTASMRRARQNDVLTKAHFSVFHPGRQSSAVRLAKIVLCALRLALAGSIALWSVIAVTAMTGTPLELFEARYRSAKTLSAVFLEQFSDNGKLIRREAGRAYFLHPGRMRWDYEAPEKNTFLVDGRYVWFYSPADRTATRIPTNQSEDWRTPLAFLTSDMKLSRICARVEEDSGGMGSEPGNFVFRCILRGSKEGTNSRSAVRMRHQDQGPPVVFEISAKGELRRIVVPQEGRTQLEFSFKDWKWNPTLPKNWFEFAPPQGAVIVDGQLSDAPGLRQ